MIHETAIVHPKAAIGKDVVIGPYAVIGEGAVIGDGVRIESHAVIENADIGEKCHIFSHAAVGTAPQDLKYKGEPTRLILGARTMVREFVTLNRGTVAHGKTVIGSDCLFMAYSHVAHDCVVGNNVITANCATLGGHVEVGDFAFLGGISAVHQFVKIGKLAMIGGGSMVSQDILPFVQTQGDRARLVGLNLVGLRRRGYKAGMIEEIKTAYRTLFLSGLPMEEALDQLEASNPCTDVRDMIDFIHASKRGIARPLHKETIEE
jgi:UDP-N-acetylglucosamine acyltransferase